MNSEEQKQPKEDKQPEAGPPHEADADSPETAGPKATSRMEHLRALVDFLKESGIVEYNSERGGEKLSLKFASAQTAAPAFDPAMLAALASRPAAAAAAPAPAASAPAKPSAPAAAEPAPAAAPAAATEESTWHIVKSPIVGTFFESPSPGSPAFVQTGDVVENGQVLCIIEAMKLMNEIESDGAGEVVKRFVNNGQPVEYGQQLYALKPRG